MSGTDLFHDTGPISALHNIGQRNRSNPTEQDKNKTHGPPLLLPLGTYHIIRCLWYCDYRTRTVWARRVRTFRGGGRGDFRDIWPFLHVAFASLLCFLSGTSTSTYPETADKQASKKQTSELPAPWGLFFYISTDYLTRPLHIYIFTFYFFISFIPLFSFFIFHFFVPILRYHGFIMGPLVRVIGEVESMVMINILVCPITRRVFSLLHQYMIHKYVYGCFSGG